MRKRIALSAVSLVLVAAGATAVLKVSSSHNGSTPLVTATTPSATASPSPNASTGQSPSPTVGPSTSASTGPSSGATQPTTSASPSNTATTLDPRKVTNAAWLTAAQLPFANTFRWEVQPATVNKLTATVFFDPKDLGLQALTVCGDPAGLLTRTIGAQGTQYFASPTGSGSSASQYVFFFSDAASAQQAFVWLQGQYGPSCLPGSGVTSTKTAGDGQTSATWLTRKGATGPVDMAPYNREYFVLRGSTIGYVSISSSSNLPAAYDDAAELSTIAAHLCVYGGPCN